MVEERERVAVCIEGMEQCDLTSSRVESNGDNVSMARKVEGDWSEEAEDPATQRTAQECHCRQNVVLCVTVTIDT